MRKTLYQRYKKARKVLEKTTGRELPAVDRMVLINAFKFWPTTLGLWSLTEEIW